MKIHFDLENPYNFKLYCPFCGSELIVSGTPPLRYCKHVKFVYIKPTIDDNSFDFLDKDFEKHFIIQLKNSKYWEKYKQEKMDEACYENEEEFEKDLTIDEYNLKYLNKLQSKELLIISITDIESYYPATFEYGLKDTENISKIS